MHDFELHGGHTRRVERRDRAVRCARASLRTASSRPAAATNRLAAGARRVPAMLGARQRIVTRYARGRGSRGVQHESNGSGVPSCRRPRRGSIAERRQPDANGSSTTAPRPIRIRSTRTTRVITAPTTRPRSAAEHVLLVRQRYRGRHRDRARRRRHADRLDGARRLHRRRAQHRGLDRQLDLRHRRRQARRRSVVGAVGTLTRLQIRVRAPDSWRPRSQSPTTANE